MSPRQTFKAGRATRGVAYAAGYAFGNFPTKNASAFADGWRGRGLGAGVGYVRVLVARLVALVRLAVYGSC